MSKDEKIFKLDGSKLVLLSVQEENLGLYRCSDADQTLKTFEVGISFKLKKMPKSFSIDEGSSTENDLKCSLHSVSKGLGVFMNNLLLFVSLVRAGGCV